MQNPALDALASARWLLAGLLLCAPPVYGTINAVPQTVSLTASWDSGELVLLRGFCVDSVKGSGGPPPGQGPPGGAPGVQRTYAVTLNTPSPVALTGDVESLPVSLTWVDIANNRSYDLQPMVTSNRELDGNPPCDNARLRVTINEPDLESAFPGVYSRDFQITLSQDPGNADPPTSVALNVFVEVTVPDRIRVSGLDDIFLGTFDGQTALSAVERVCVFRASGGNYRVILRGDGSANAFSLASATDSLSYSARWNQLTIDHDTPLGGQPAGRFGGDTLCGGETNADLEIQVAVEDALAVREGEYSGVLTVIVEME